MNGIGENRKLVLSWLRELSKEETLFLVETIVSHNGVSNEELKRLYFNRFFKRKTNFAAHLDVFYWSLFGSSKLNQDLRLKEFLPDKKLKLLVERFNVFVDGVVKEFLEEEK